MLPTAAQSLQAVIICQWLSNGYQPITVFRYDLRAKTIYVQGGVDDSISLIIFSDGNWRFVQ